MVILASVSGIGAAYVWWTSIARQYSWKGRHFRITRLGKEQIYDLEQLVDIELLEIRDELRLVFADGRRVTLSADLHGCEELAEHIETLTF